jgi:branched-chain amino acid transport system ATP-binding protein
MAILKVENLTKNFGGVSAVRNVQLEFKEGELCSIIGPNGAGKTTFFKMIMGLLPPTSGNIFFQEKNITHLPTHKIASLGICQTFQIISIFPNLSVLENIRMAIQSRSKYNFNFFNSASKYLELQRMAQEIVNDVHLAGRESSNAKNLSYGEKRRLEIGITAARDPVLILLDEPTAGMSHEEILDTIKLIQNISARKTVIMVEHNIDVVFSLSSRVIVLNRGEVISDGSPKQIQQDEGVKRAYLGKQNDT